MRWVISTAREGAQLAKISEHLLNWIGAIFLLVIGLLALCKPRIWIQWLASYYHAPQLSEENQAVVWLLRFLGLCMLGFSVLVLLYA